MANSALAVDHRSRARQQVSVEVQYSYRRGKCTYHGTGRTRDFGDQTVCFESDQDLPGDVELELSIAWPVSLQGQFPVDMVVHGGLLRKQNGLIVLKLEDYEFRTRGNASFHSSADKGMLCNLLA
jgi:hypothetical protein